VRKVEEKEVREETVFHTNRAVLMRLLCRHIQLCATSSTDCFHETFFFYSQLFCRQQFSIPVCVIFHL
jgi:hypothetical protein